jgi:cytochrome P450
MHLARRELQLAFVRLLGRLRNIRLAVPNEEVDQVPLPFHRAIERLPVRFEVAA